ncbi:MAG: hypothetical protein WD226_06430 [Planctomycetota bacterium]
MREAQDAGGFRPFPPYMDDALRIPFEIHPQLDDTTCGPVCLHALYRHYGDDVSLEQLLREVAALELGGTLGALLARHALERGYGVTLVTWNLRVFDPTWFGPHERSLAESLRASAAVATDPMRRFAATAYAEFLERGGTIEYRDLEPAWIVAVLRSGRPILTALSATFLYGTKREIPETNVSDDLAGSPVGHFVVLTGYLPATAEVLVSDPLHPNPLSETHTYPVPVQRLIGAIYLGVLTYDANLLVFEPPASNGA